MDNLDVVLRGLDIEKQRINMVDEMGRRMGISQELARTVLAAETARANRDKESVDMTLVALAITILGEDARND